MGRSNGFCIPKEELPWLGIGVATEHVEGDPSFLRLHEEHPDLVQFVEYGGTVELGLDVGISNWVRSGHPATYHYLDINLGYGPPLSREWCESTAELARQMGAPWICGDVGIWYYGQRLIKNVMLTHPILSLESADSTAEAICELQERTGFNCFPENPPSHFYPGDIHLLDYFSRLTERADCWMTLDCAHLLMYQYAHGHEPLTGLDGFPLDRVGEIHIAGGTLLELDHERYIIDSHIPQVLPGTWAIVDYVLPRAANVRAVCLEAEEQQIPPVARTLEQVHERCRRLAIAA